MTSGPPTKKTQKILDEIIDRIVNGESLVKILRSSEKYPNYSGFMRWLSEDPVLQDNYTKAKQEQADYLVEEIMDIADNSSNDWMEHHDPDNPGYKFNGDHYQRSRLRVDTRKWIASKMKPKKYGDRIDHNHGSDPKNPVSVVINTGANPYKKDADKP